MRAERQAKWHVPLVSGKVFFCINRVDRAFRYAHRAIDALIRINGQKIGPFHKAIHGANIHTVGVLSWDAALCHNMGHGLSGTALDLSKSFQMNRYILVPRRSGKGVAVSGVGEFVHGDTSASQHAIGTGVIQAVSVGHGNIAAL